MPTVERTMTPAQMVALLDAALQSQRPLDYVNATVTTFRMIGRGEDCITTAWLGFLYAGGEMEILMALRAAWRRGEVLSPAEVVRNTVTD